MGQINGVNFSTPANTGANFSVEAWVYLNTDSIQYAAVVSQGWLGSQFGWGLDTGGANNDFRICFYSANGAAYATSPGVARSLSTWCHVVGVVNESIDTMYVYINGAAQATASWTGSVGLIYNNQPLTIGARPVGAGGPYVDQMNANMANIALYNYALSATQVQNHYLAASGSPVLVEVPTNTTVFQGQTATFYSSAAGAAPLTYQWQLNGAALTNGPSPSGTGATISGATNATLTISGVTLADSGETYSVVVTNNVGATPAAAATLTVEGVGLAAQASSTNIVLAWPSGASGYQLQSNTNLANTNAWVNVTNSVSVGNGQSQVTLPLSAEAMFFRLQFQ